jgi:hypothetical protein
VLSYLKINDKKDKIKKQKEINMTCTHIDRTLDKINNLIETINDKNSSLYEKNGTYVNFDKIKEKFFNKGKNMEEISIFGLLVISDKVQEIGVVPLHKHLSDIFNLLTDCNCCSNISSIKSNLDSYKSDYSYMKDKHDKLDREFKDLRNEKKEKDDEIKDLREKLEQEQRGRKDDKTRYDDEKLTWTRTEGEKNVKIAKLEEKSENDNTEKTKLEKRAEDAEKDRDKQVGRLEIKVDEKTLKIQNLTDQLTKLQITGGKKDNEIHQKDEEIRLLKRWARLSREELLDEKQHLKYGKLEVFANQIGINLQQVSDLCRYYERLVHARKNYNQANIETHEDNITRVREGLRQNGIQIENIQKFCNKCEKIAKMRVEINEIRQQQNYEARQEVPPLNNNRID